MTEPSIEELNNIRKEGFRPGVVACIVNDKKILMFYKKEHKLWQLPQGRIANKEKAIDALARNLEDELGSDFVKNLDFNNVEFLDTDKMEFKPGKHEIEALTDDEGNEVTMLGKYYYFCLVPAFSKEIDIAKTQFDDFFWLDFKEASFLSNKIYQKGKRRITLKVINNLQSLGKLE